MQFRVLSAVATAAVVVSAQYTTTTSSVASTTSSYSDQCAATCAAAFSTCKSQPNANNSYCVSQYAGCLGYNPFAPGAPSPTACSSSSSPTPTPSTSPAQCATACSAAFDNCKAQPNENNSYCVSQYAMCLGYNPFNPGAPSPTACSSSSSPTPTPSSGGADQCATACSAAFDNCKAQPNANNSYCVSQYAGCLGYNPFAPGAPSPTACVSQSTTTMSPSTAPAGSMGTVGPTKAPTSTVPFNGAGANKPAVGGILALGLLAML